MLKAASDYDRMAHEAEQHEIAQGLSYLRAVASEPYLARLSVDNPDLIGIRLPSKSMAFGVVWHAKYWV